MQIEASASREMDTGSRANGAEATNSASRAGNVDRAEAGGRERQGDELGIKGEDKADKTGDNLTNTGDGQKPASMEAASSETDSSELSELEALEKENIRLAQEASEANDKYMRAVAECENIRRRADKDRTEQAKFGLSGFFMELLPVLDTIDQALVSGGTDAAQDAAGQNDNNQQFAQGVEMLKKQLLTALEKNGLSAVESVGKPFDPQLHQAIQRIDSCEVESEIVGQEFAKGYLLHGRLLRPAMVSVLVPNPEATTAP